MKLTLDSLHTWRTYAGVMEGVPSSKQMIESAKKRVETSYCIGRPIYVIEPWGQYTLFKTSEFQV